MVIAIIIKYPFRFLMGHAVIEKYVELTFLNSQKTRCFQYNSNVKLCNLVKKKTFVLQNSQICWRNILFEVIMKDTHQLKKL